MVSSSIAKQINSLRKSIKEQINYFDVNFKDIDKNGSIQVSNLACVTQAYKIWLMSDMYDYHRRPGMGGFLVKNVIKRPLSAENAKIIESQLIKETGEIFPTINVLKCEVTANMARRRWELRIAIQDKRSGLIDSSMSTDDGMITYYPDNV